MAVDAQVRSLAPHDGFDVQTQMRLYAVHQALAMALGLIAGIVGLTGYLGFIAYSPLRLTKFKGFLRLE
jgi:hypothetical protein